MKKLLLLMGLILFVVVSPQTLSAAKLMTYHDMVLLYSGGYHRTHYWDVAHTKPYVTYVDENGKEHWMFDAFLYLEIHTGRGKMFASGYTDRPTDQQDWKRLADHYLQADTCVGALDKTIEAAKQRLGKPETKHKVVIGLPEPLKNQKNWGTASDGRKLDLAKDEDRIEACRWYIDYVCKRFKEMKYKNVELAGFYWIAEEATNTRTIIHQVGEYLNKLDLSFNWIPWFRSDGFEEWKDLGFNYAYLQPNFFFNETVPYSRLNDACKLAKQFDLDMEMEFDERVQTGFGYRLYDYMKAFKQNGCWHTKRLAYYQGCLALYNLYVSDKKEDKDLYHTFCKFVVEHPVK